MGPVNESRTQTNCTQPCSRAAFTCFQLPLPTLGLLSAPLGERTCGFNPVLRRKFSRSPRSAHGLGAVSGRPVRTVGGKGCVQRSRKSPAFPRQDSSLSRPCGTVRALSLVATEPSLRLSLAKAPGSGCSGCFVPALRHVHRSLPAVCKATASTSQLTPRNT